MEEILQIDDFWDPLVIPEVIGTKRCPRCKKIKSKLEFTKTKTRKDGLSVYCKKCCSLYKKDYVTRNHAVVLAKQAEYRRLNRDIIRAKGRIYYQNNKSKYMEYNIKNKEKISMDKRNWKRNNREMLNANKRYVRSGWTKTAYDKAVLKQENKCFLCGLEESAKTGVLHADHDHTTNDIRALLCHKCNSALGMFNEDVDLLWNAIKYIIYFKMYGSGTEYIETANLNTLCLPSLDEIVAPVLGKNWRVILNKGCDEL